MKTPLAKPLLIVAFVVTSFSISFARINSLHDGQTVAPANREEDSGFYYWVCRAFRISRCAPGESGINSADFSLNTEPQPRENQNPPGKHISRAYMSSERNTGARKYTGLKDQSRPSPNIVIKKNNMFTRLLASISISKRGQEAFSDKVRILESVVDKKDSSHFEQSEGGGAIDDDPFWEDFFRAESIWREKISRSFLDTFRIIGIKLQSAFKTPHVSEELLSHINNHHPLTTKGNQKANAEEASILVDSMQDVVKRGRYESISMEQQDPERQSFEVFDRALNEATEQVRRELENVIAISRQPMSVSSDKDVLKFAQSAIRAFKKIQTDISGQSDILVEAVISNPQLSSKKFHLLLQSHHVGFRGEKQKILSAWNQTFRRILSSISSRLRRKACRRRGRGIDIPYENVVQFLRDWIVVMMSSYMILVMLIALIFCWLDMTYDIFEPFFVVVISTIRSFRRKHWSNEDKGVTSEESDSGTHESEQADSRGVNISGRQENTSVQGDSNSSLSSNFSRRLTRYGMEVTEAPVQSLLTTSPENVEKKSLKERKRRPSLAYPNRSEANDNSVVVPLANVFKSRKKTTAVEHVKTSQIPKNTKLPARSSTPRRQTNRRIIAARRNKRDATSPEMGTYIEESPVATRRSTRTGPENLQSLHRRLNLTPGRKGRVPSANRD